MDFGHHYLATKAVCLVSRFNSLAAYLIFFLSVTAPAGLIQYSQAFTEAACFIIKLMCPFIAGLDTPVMSMKNTINMFTLRLGV